MTKIKNKKLILRVLVWSVALALVGFMYRQLYFSYLVMEKSNRISELLLHKQSLLMQVKNKELVLVKDNLKDTEIMVNQLERENNKLRGQIKLLDKMVELEGAIMQLKDKNSQLEEKIVNLKDLPPDFDENVKTLQDGKKWLAQYSDWINKIKGRMKTLKKNDYERRVAKQREKDHIDSLLGNNGYVMKDGQSLPREIPSSAPQNVKIDVNFVK